MPITGTNAIESLWTTLGSRGGAAVGYLEYIGALALSFALATTIAWVYQRTYAGRRYQQDFVHTLVIMGVVVSVVIMVVGDNLARAFGIFAAFSMIRFRRNLPEARDLGFLFFALVVGLTVGAREYGFALLTTVLVCAAIAVISRLDLFAPPAAGLALRVRVPVGLDYEAAFEDVFRRLAASVRLVSSQTVADDEQTELRYEVQLREGVAPGDLVAELYSRNEGLAISLQAPKKR